MNGALGFLGWVENLVRSCRKLDTQPCLGFAVSGMGHPDVRDGMPPWVYWGKVFKRLRLGLDLGVYQGIPCGVRTMLWSRGACGVGGCFLLLGLS